MENKEKQFEQIVSRLNVDDRPNTEHKKALRKHMLTAAKDSSKKIAPRIQPVWSKIMHSKITKRIAAAIILIAGTLSLTIFNKTVPQAYAIEQTVEAMKKAHNVHGIFIDREGRRVNAWGKIDSTTGMISVMRIEYQGGGLYIITPDQTYFEDDGLIAVKEGQYMKCGLLFNDFISEAAQEMQNLGMMEVKKEYSEEFQREVICVNIKQPQVHLEAIVDPETNLPMKFSIPWVSYPNEPLDYTELIEYNIDLPPGFFDFEIGPDTMILGKHLDRQFANDPNYGIPYEDTEDLQEFCKRLATEYLQARIDRNIEKIKQLHAGHINRNGSSKMIKNNIVLDEYRNGRMIEIMGFKPSYEYGPRQMMVPCKVLKEHNGQSQEMFSGVLIYLREHEGQKSAIITGWFPSLSEKQIDNSK